MLDKYIHEGTIYDVKAEELDQFLIDHPGAEKIGLLGADESKEEDQDLDSTPQPLDLTPPPLETDATRVDTPDLSGVQLAEVEQAATPEDIREKQKQEADLFFDEEKERENKVSNVTLGGLFATAYSEESSYFGDKVKEVLGSNMLDEGAFAAYAVQDPTGKELKKVFEEYYEYMRTTPDDIPNSGFFKTTRRVVTKNDGSTELAYTPLFNADEIWNNTWGKITSQEQDSAEKNQETIALNQLLGKTEEELTEEDTANLNAQLSNIEELDIKTYGGLSTSEAEKELKLLNKALREKTIPDSEMEAALARHAELVDEVFYVDEARTIGTTVIKTGKRIPNPAMASGNFNIFHDFDTGRNLTVPKSEGDVSGENVVDATGFYNSYLSMYDNTSLGVLEEEYDRLLLQEIGWKKESGETITLAANDGYGEEMIAALGKYFVPLDTGTIFDESGVRRGVFEIPLSVIVSKNMGNQDYFSNALRLSGKSGEKAAFGEVAYDNTEEFWAYSNFKRNMVGEMAGKKAVLHKLLHLNQDPETLPDRQGGRALRGFVRSLPLMGGVDEQSLDNITGITDSRVHDLTLDLTNELGIEISEDAKRHLERDFGDKAVETLGGLGGISLTLMPINYAVGLTRLPGVFQSLRGTRYMINAGGRTRTVGLAGAKRYAASRGATLSSLESAGIITTRGANAWEKGASIIGLGLLEDLKMREGMGLLGAEKFDRGVGFGFSLLGNVLPFRFKTTIPGSGLDLSTRNIFKKYPRLQSNQLDTFNQLVFKNGPSFAIAAEGSEAIGAMVENLHEDGAWREYVKTNWSDYKDVGERALLHIMSGSVLGAAHLKKYDLKSYEQIQSFNNQAMQKVSNIEGELMLDYRQETGNSAFENPEAYNTWKVGQTEKYNQLQKYSEDYMMSNTYLMRAENAEAWTDPVKGPRLHQKYVEPLQRFFESQGVELEVSFSTEPVYQERVVDGEVIKERVAARYVRLDAKEGGAGKAMLEVDLSRSTGQGTLSHEMLHAYLDITFQGKPQLKAEFASDFKSVLEQVQVGGKNLFEEIITDPALEGKKDLQLEEMMAYTAEYLSKPGNAAKLPSDALSKLARFWNNFAKSSSGQNANLYTGAELVNMLATFGRTGNIGDLKHLDKYITIGEGTTSGDMSSRTFIDGNNVKETGNNAKDALKKQKEDLIKQNTELTKTQPEGWREIAKQNSDAVKEINKQMEMLDGILKEGDPRELINQHLNKKKRDAEGNVEKDAKGKDVYEKRFTKEDLKTEEGKKAVKKTMAEIFNSKLIETMILKDTKYEKKNRNDDNVKDFLSNVRKNLFERLEKNYDPDVNPDVFGWLSGVSGGRGESILFRAKGDAMVESNKTEKMVELDAIEGYENMFGEGSAGEFVEATAEQPTTRRNFTETVEFSDAEKQKIEQTVREAEVDVDNLSYKDVKKLLKGDGRPPTSAKDVKVTGPLAEVLRTVSDKFGVPLERVIANQTLSGKIRNSARDYIKSNAQELIDALPEGTTPSGKSTGIANTKLGEFYVKQGRVSMAKTGSAEGLAEQVKQEVSTQDFLDMFGINADGSYAKGTKFDSAIKELIVQTASITANQSARSVAGKLQAKIGEGRGEAMASRIFDTFKESFPEYSSEQIQDAFFKAYYGMELTPAERKYFDNIEVSEFFKNRDDMILFGLIESTTMVAKSEQFKFNKVLEEFDLNFEKVFESGEKITGEEIRNLIDISATRSVKDGKVILKEEKIKEMLGHSSEVGKLIFSAAPQLFGNKSLISQLLFIHQRTTAEGVSKDKYITETGESAIGKEFTRGQATVLSESRKQKDLSPEDVAAIKKIWEGVKIEFTSVNSQVTGAKKMRGATVAEQIKIQEKYFSELSESTKEAIYDAMGKTLEYYVGSSKTKAEYLSRAEYVMKGMRGNTNLRLGFRQLAPVIAVYKGNRTFTENQIKLEHLKTSVAQSGKAAELIIKGEWSLYGKETLKDFVGVLSPKELLDIIDAKGGKTNMSALYRMAILEPSTLAEFGTVESGGKETLLDYVLREGKKDFQKDLQRLGREERLRVVEEFKRDKSNIAKAEVILRNSGLLGKSENVGASMASKTFENHRKALELGRKRKKEPRGMSTFDFDETLIIKGENFVTAKKGSETIRISSENFPVEGPRLEAEGYEFDFKDFVNVKGGVEGPLFKKLQNQIAKYGNENVFVLTARMQDAAPAIQAWLKSKGVDLAIENITGLGNSAGEAKARWMLEKFAEGYNDMYFVDDAVSNVEAVRKVLDQLDIKSNVQQALASRDFNAEVNKIMQSTFGIDANKTFSKAEGRMRGKDKKRRRLFLPDSASDLELLLEPLYGKGSEGVKNKKWFSENFYKKFERGINEYNTAKQKLTTEYMQLRKNNKQTVKDLSKEVPGTSFTNDMAMRVYLWNKAGFTIPDLAATTQKKLVDHIQANPRYRRYAESVARMTGIETGLKEPTAEWWAETLATEISDANRGVGRKEYLSDFIEAKEEIFSEANLNKMESELGKDWRDNIEDMFQRMETGRSRSEKLTGITGDVINYFNGSIGAIMNFNTRSAVLQLISTANFVNMDFNNPARAAQAFANQKQYWSDFMRIMNSDMLKQRRGGLEINVTEAEIAAAAKESKNPAKAVMARIMKAGYIPTKYADSFAIAAGGATYYRNAIRKYMKEGLSKAEAERKAFIDFQAIAERTQQSSRPDLISREQTTLAGRLILPFANTPLQMNRLAMREMLDIYKGRYKGPGELTNKLGKIGYYGFVQTIFFAGLQSAAFAIFGNSEDDELKAKKQGQMIDTVVDSGLRGMGIKGAILNGVVNAAKELETQAGKDYGADYSEVAEDLLNISPPIGSKFRKLDAAGNTYKYNKEQIDEEGIEFSLDSPGLQAATQVTEAITNLPANRIFKKANNVKNAMSDEYEPWQRFLMFLGWSNWDVAPEQAKDQAQGKKKKKDKPRKELKDAESIL